MKRFLTLALLASAMSFPAMAQNNSASSGAGVGTGVGVGVGADVGVGASGDTSSDSGTMSPDGATFDADAGSNAQVDVDSDADADANINAQADTDTDTSMGRTATGDTSIGGTGSMAASQSLRGENLARNDVILIQQALRQEGLLTGTADGIWGPRTASALMQFQQRNQLGATGQINNNTLDSLGVQLGSSASGDVSSDGSVGTQ